MLTFKQFINESYVKFEDSVPITFEYIHNTEKSPKLADKTRFGQHIEPAGKYVNEKPSTFKSDYYPNIEVGEITFNKPLVIDFGGGYQEESNWKYVLSKQFKNKKGKALSKEITKAGYDGIVTMNKGHSSEIVDIRMFK